MSAVHILVLLCAVRQIFVGLEDGKIEVRIPPD